MRLSDERLEQIRAWLNGRHYLGPSPQPPELAAMADELHQLRLRTSSRSRSAAAGASHAAKSG